MNIQNVINFVAHSSYIDKILNYMDDIEYRRVLSAEDLDKVARLRAAAYKKAGSFTNPAHPVTDALDLDPRVFVYAVYWNEKLVSTVRVHILSAENLQSNAYTYFPNVLQPLLDQGMSFMDPTKFVIDPELDEDISGLAMITLRIGFLAAKHFNCDFCLSMIRPRHSGFYRRIFQSTQITPHVQFKTFSDPYALFSSPRSKEEPICARYPIFRSTATERALLFEPAKPGLPGVLNVRPTARIAIRQLQASADQRQAGIV